MSERALKTITDARRSRAGRPAPQGAQDRTRLCPAPDRRLRRPAPLRARVAALAGVGRQAVGARRDRAGRPVDEVDRPPGHRRRPRDRGGREERKAALNIARRGESSAGVSGALTLAGTEDRASSSRPTTWTPTRSCSTAPTATLDLRTGEAARPHDPAPLLTKMTGAAFDPAANGAAFAEVPGARPARRRRCATTSPGSSATPWRAGWSSTSCRSSTATAPTGRAPSSAPSWPRSATTRDAADPELLNARTFDAHPTGVADLFGLRLAVLHESDAGRRLAEGTVKRLTGGDRLKARRMREDFWRFEPSHTFVMLTNHKPIVTGQDEGIWRRLRLVPWDVVIPPEERDERLGDRLALERMPSSPGSSPATRTGADAASRARQGTQGHCGVPRRERRPEAVH